MFQTRAEYQQEVRRLWEPVLAHASPGGARMRLGHSGAHFSTVAAELEGFARPLWGLTPLAAGGGHVDWEPVLRGLTSGTDPDNSEFWGWAAGRDQRLVEMAPIGAALAMTPEHIWEPLSAQSKANLARWLGRINAVDIVDNNWLFFRVLVNVGLERVGSPEYDAGAETAALDRLESFYLGDGWYEDGPTGRCDYYLPWAMHYYGLMYARLAGDRDHLRARRFRERAVEFAQQHVAWFAADGAAVPYGRSLTYRFAQAGLWGALAFADVEALPWGVVKGLLARNLRWWADRPVYDNGGVLTIGYGYPNLIMAESYNSPGSPYWAMKAFLPLALPESHPFWQAREEVLPASDAVAVQPNASAIICRDEDGDHVFALTGGQPGMKFRHGREKYTKFAYSSSFGFSVPTGYDQLDRLAADSMLALSDDEMRWRVRGESEESHVSKGYVWSRWCPWPDVEIESWMVPLLPWHVRVHRIRTGRRLWTAEGGWAVSRGDVESWDEHAHELSGSSAAVIYPDGASGIRDLSLVARTPEVVIAEPNTNLIHPRTAIPTLRAVHDTGEGVLVCAVLGRANPATWDGIWAKAPTMGEIRAGLPAEALSA